nr:MAG TPA: hypothetical protein [Caudoviricetes sp.]
MTKSCIYTLIYTQNSRHISVWVQLFVFVSYF